MVTSETASCERHSDHNQSKLLVHFSLQRMLCLRRQLSSEMCEKVKTLPRLVIIWTIGIEIAEGIFGNDDDGDDTDADLMHVRHVG